MKRILVAGALALAAGGQSLAADLPQPAPPPPPRAPATYVPIAPPAYNWGGFYIGLNAGGAWVSQAAPTNTIATRSLFPAGTVFPAPLKQQHGFRWWRPNRRQFPGQPIRVRRRSRRRLSVNKSTIVGTDLAGRRFEPARLHASGIFDGTRPTRLRRGPRAALCDRRIGDGRVQSAAHPTLGHGRYCGRRHG